MTQYFVPDRNIRNLDHFPRTMEVLGLNPTRIENFNYSNRYSADGWAFTREEFATLAASISTDHHRGDANRAISSYHMRDGRDGCKWMHSDYAIAMPKFDDLRHQMGVYPHHVHLHEEQVRNVQFRDMFSVLKDIFDVTGDRDERTVLWSIGTGRVHQNHSLSGHSSYYEIVTWGGIDSCEYTQTLPENVFGINHPYRMKGMAPARGSSYDVVENGVTIAQYFETVPGVAKARILFLFPLKILDAIPTGGEIIIKTLENIRTALNVVSDFSGDMYKSFQMAALSKAVESQKNAFTAAETRVKNDRAKFFTSLKNYNELKDVVETYENGLQKKITSTAFDSELEAIRALPKVNSIMFSVRKGGIIISTSMLKCVHPKTKAVHEIGEFDISINVNADISSALIWNNKTRKPNGKHAPHIGRDGKAALGNMAEMLPEILGSGDLKLIAQIAIQFIESVNISDDWGKTISDYPVVENGIVQASAEAVAA